MRARKAVAPKPPPEAEAYEWPTILDQAKEPVFVHDEAGRVLRCNAPYAAAAGQPMASIVGKPYWQVFPKLAGLPPQCCGSHDSVAEQEALVIGRAGNIFATHEIVARKPSGAFWYCRHYLEDVTARKQLEDDLARERTLLGAIIESAPHAFFLLDEEARLVRWNSYLGTRSGLSEAELKGFQAITLVHEDDRALAAAKFLTVLATGSARMELRVTGKGGAEAVLLATARRVEIGDVPYVAGFCTDISERKRAERQLAEQAGFSRLLIENVPGLFCVVDAEGNYYRWNSNLNRLTGLSDADLDQRSSLLTVAESDRQLAAAKMREAFEKGYAKAVVRVVTRDRGTRAFLFTARRFEVGESRYLVGVGIDTTDQVEEMRALEQEAHTDGLTHVANRGHFLDRAVYEFARSRRYGHPLSVWMLDLDHFKVVNDTHGHAAGDAVLRAFVGICQQTLRDWDVMGRLGGEEFGVLLPETDARQALLVAERLRQAVSAASVPVAAGQSITVTVSIGTAAMAPDDADVQAVLARADAALYEAKRTGRDKVCVA
ncbi:MAG: diguanylate cyclase [Ignavibacteria bacterium]